MRIEDKNIIIHPSPPLERKKKMLSDKRNCNIVMFKSILWAEHIGTIYIVLFMTQRFSNLFVSRAPFWALPVVIDLINCKGFYDIQLCG